MAIKCISETLPVIYCYSTPDITTHKGWVKIGYTEQTVEKRNRYLNTAGVRWIDEWHDFAIYTDGSGLTFTDDDFRVFLVSKGINTVNDFGENGEPIGDEWCQISPDEARKYFDEFKKAPSVTMALRKYHLRSEQKKAVDDTVKLKESNVQEALWNAKPRFGKCLSCYDFCKEIDAKNVLIVTNRPAVGNSWYSDYIKYLGRESGYFFVSHVPDIAKEEKVIDYPEYEKHRKTFENNPDAIDVKLLYFVSLQDIKGSQYFGTGGYSKLKELTQIEWDVLVVDESHEGVDTYKTETAFNYINRKFTLYLSGTPFKAIADEKFDSEAIYNWTYVSEQEAKERWNGEGDNPYMVMPKLRMNTYRLSNIIDRPIDFSGEEDIENDNGMNELFKVVGGKFVHEEDVDRFLDVISSDEKYPFGCEESRRELKHTFWLLQSVSGDNHAANVKVLALKLREHPVFKDYEIIIAADNGKADETDISGSNYKKVMQAIESCENGTSKKRGTITLSVKSLTTGVTVPQWTGVLMLSERNSAAEYMQASFRAQNPYIFSRTNKMTGKTTFHRKTESYVFDFNPEHTLDIVEEFANSLYSETANGKGDYDDRRKNIEKLLQYMPVTGENDDGVMQPFEAEMVMLIPRKMRSEEVVRKGFMCDKLFQNIVRVFRINDNGSAIVNKLPIITQSTPKKSVEPLTITEEDIKDMHLDENGDVNVSEDFIETEVETNVDDNDKKEIETQVKKDLEKIQISIDANGKEKDDEREDFISAYTKTTAEKVTEDIKRKYSDAISKNTEKKIKREIMKEARETANKLYSDYMRNTKMKEDEINESTECKTEEDKEKREELIRKSKEEAARNFKENAISSVDDFVFESYKIAVAEKETAVANEMKNAKLDEFKKRLKSFTRTIPSFLMAYGDENIRLENMDTYVDPDVFQEVAYITVDEFRVLRDECKYFEPIVCNDAMQNFLQKKDQLADYFDENCFAMMEGQRVEDIFDLIPPQRTNQIYTPKTVVQKMCDYLEQENPGCFDDPNATFIDLYMKSGLYITEIVKRLYKSEILIELFPDENDRLMHIFDKQVYGLAPTTIIYKIATNYILGFAKKRNLNIKTTHFVELDALPYAQKTNEDGLKLEEKLDEVFI